MELISMTDFVLEQSESIKSDMIGYGEFIDKVVNYANFLKQPLKLEMFVPCNDSEKAKEKVLFKDCSTMQQGENTMVILNDSVIWLTWTNRIIEDLLKDRVILTENALKQIGI